MKQPIKYVDTLGFQQELDDKFGSGIYEVVWEPDDHDQKQKYIISSAENPEDLPVIMSMVDDHHKRSFDKLLTRMLERIDKRAKSIIDDLLLSFKMIEYDYAEATLWLTNTSQSCPFSVVFVAKKLHITNEQAANKIIADKQKIDDVKQQINNIRNTAKLNLINCVDISLPPSIAFDAINEMKNVINAT